MTRKDYKLLAAAIADTPLTNSAIEERVALIGAISLALMSENSRFSPTRFAEAAMAKADWQVTR